MGVVEVSPLRCRASLSAVYLSYQQDNGLFSLILPLLSMYVCVFSEGVGGRGIGATK